MAISDRRDAGLDGSGRSQNQFAILPNTTLYTLNTLNTPEVAATIGPFLEASKPTGTN